MRLTLLLTLCNKKIATIGPVSPYFIIMYKVVNYSPQIEASLCKAKSLSPYYHTRMAYNVARTCDVVGRGLFASDLSSPSIKSAPAMSAELGALGAPAARVTSENAQDLCYAAG